MHAHDRMVMLSRGGQEALNFEKPDGFLEIKKFAALVHIAFCQETSHELMVGQKMNFFLKCVNQN